MLLSFSFENFLSFKDRVKMNFKAGTIKDLPENIYSSYFDDELKVLKSLGLYGANSSGKSNIIKAFAFFRNFILNSSKESNAAQKIPVKPFLLAESSEQNPSLFEAEFYLNEVRYRYGFKVTTNSVVEEWLFQTYKRKDEMVFIRAKQIFSFEKKFRTEFKSKLDTLAEFTNINSLYISVLAQFNIQIAQDIIKWFNSSIIANDTDHTNLIDFTANLLSNPTYSGLINDIMVHSGFGISGIKGTIKELAAKTNYSIQFLNTLFEQEIKKYSVKTRHLKFNLNNKPLDNIFFDLIEHESLGTQKFFGLLGPVLIALKEHRLLFVDEIDARLHTTLLESLIKLFNSVKYNPNGAQLVFTSHNTTLLKDDMRRDQMVFVNKNEMGSSTFENLHVSNPKVRNDATFDKDYLSGKYGAIPNLSTQLNLFEK